MNLIDMKPKKNGIPCLSKDDLEVIATDILSVFDCTLLTKPQPLDVDRLAEHHLGIRLDFADLSNNGSVLGLMAFYDCRIPTFDTETGEVRTIPVKARTAVIDTTVMNEQEYRGRFTIAHECAHWIIHKPDQYHFSNQVSLPLDEPGKFEEKVIICRKSKAPSKRAGLRTPADWREWQADNLASYLLMPKSAVIEFVKGWFETTKNESRWLLKSSSGVTYAIHRSVLIKELADRFNVSCQAAEIRLKQLQILTEDPSEQARLPI